MSVVGSRQPIVMSVVKQRFSLIYNVVGHRRKDVHAVYCAPGGTIRDLLLHPESATCIGAYRMTRNSIQP